MSKGNYTPSYAKDCGKLAKEIRNTSKRNKEFKSKQEPKKEDNE